VLQETLVGYNWLRSVSKLISIASAWNDPVRVPIFVCGADARFSISADFDPLKTIVGHNGTAGAYTPTPFHSRSRRISAIAVASPPLCRTIRRSSRPIATVIPLFKYHRETARPASLFFQMGFMLRHNGTEISIRSTNIISDYTAANGVALRWPPRVHADYTLNCNAWYRIHAAAR